MTEQMSMDGFSADSSAIQTGFGRRFFPGAKRSEVLSQIQHLVHYGNMVVNISADEGMGKSYMLEAVNGVFSGKVLNVRATLLMSSLELLNQIFNAVLSLKFHHDSTDFSPPSGESELISVIHSYLLRLKDTGLTAVLLVDDAHELSEEALAALLQLVMDDSVSGCLKCVLFSEPYLNELLKKPGLSAVDTEQVFSLSLNHLTQMEVAEYLDFVEASKPESERILYTDKDVARIFELSQGKLGQVKPAVKRLLEEVPVKPKVSFSYKLGIAGLVGFSLILVVLSVMYQAADSTPDQADAIDDDALTLDSQRILPKSAVEEASGEETALTANVSEVPSKGSSLLEKLKQQQAEIHKAEADALLVDVEVQGADSKSESAKLPVITEVVVENEVPQFNQAPKEAVVDSLDYNFLSGDEWIFAQPARNITFQVLGAHSKKNVDRYMQRFKGDQSQLVVYESIRAGKPWYALIHGSYVSRADAEKAALEEGFKTKSVWFRSFQSIKDEMNKP